jgi:hypothetical protein
MLAVICILFAGCGTRPVTRGISEPPRMIEAILGQIPVGTPIDEAQSFMGREGFECSRMVNESFGERKGLDSVVPRSAGDG